MAPNPYDPMRPPTAGRRPERTPTLARRLLPMVALGGAAGALVMALDHPGSGAASATAANGTGAVSLDPLSADGGVVINEQTANAVASTVPAAPQVTSAASAASSAPAATTPASTATTQKAASSACRTYRGPVEDNRFGPVQVQASVSSNGTICSVKVLQSPTGGKSDRINARAVPILNKQAMAAQSANINGVSGATYTTIGYIDSLQAILDAAKG